MSVSRINFLVDELNVHCRQYYLDDAPSINDESYDKMFQELKELESQLPFSVRPDSPTQRIGDKVSSAFPSVPHLVPMLSLDNAFTVEDMSRALVTMNSVYKGVSAELKADGLALNLTYEKGILVRATTRGTGSEGELVTHSVKTIQAIPLKLNTSTPPDLIEIRGESVLPRVSLAKYNKKAAQNGTKPLANARNGAAGAIRQLDPKKAAERHLSFQAYAIGFVSENYLLPTTQSALLDMFLEWGFEVSEYRAICFTVEDCEKVFNDVIAKRDSFEIDIDGIVFKTNTLSAREHIGSTSRHPKWAIAWKLPPEMKQTKLIDVKFQTGRTGAITPVGHILPVSVGGVTVSTVTLHNEEHLVERLKLRVGDTLSIFRAGDVVPSCDSRIDLPEQANAPFYSFTKECPSCGGAIEKHDAVWYCMNESLCPAQITNRIIRATSRDCLDIEGFGSALADTLTEAGIIYDYADIFTLNKHRDTLMAMEGYGQKSVDKLLKGIEMAKNVPFERFIYLLGIEEVGRSLSAILAKKYRSLDALMSASKSDLFDTVDVGEITSTNIHDFFLAPENQKMIERLLQVGVMVVEPQSTAPSSSGADYSGKTFVVTGSFSTIARKDIENHIKSHAGKVSGSPSAKTFATIVGDKAGTKLQKSQELGLTIVTDEQIVQSAGADIDKLARLLMSLNSQAA